MPPIMYAPGKAVITRLATPHHMGIEANSHSTAAQTADEVNVIHMWTLPKASKADHVFTRHSFQPCPGVAWCCTPMCFRLGAMRSVSCRSTHEQLRRGQACATRLPHLPSSKSVSRSIIQLWYQSPVSQHLVYCGEAQKVSYILVTLLPLLKSSMMAGTRIRPSWR
jgi:hypothetical protein